LFLVVSSDLGSDGVGVVLHGFVVVEFFCCKVRRFFATGAQKKKEGRPTVHGAAVGSFIVVNTVFRVKRLRPGPKVCKIRPCQFEL
jgi:hypothetical protein